MCGTRDLFPGLINSKNINFGSSRKSDSVLIQFWVTQIRTRNYLNPNYNWQLTSPLVLVLFCKISVLIPPISVLKRLRIQFNFNFNFISKRDLILVWVLLTRTNDSNLSNWGPAQHNIFCIIFSMSLKNMYEKHCSCKWSMSTSSECFVS
jgi:hypothetical protein